MSHPTTIGHAFWDGVRTFYRNFRRLVATSDEPSGRALVVHEAVEDIRSELGSSYFGPNWEFSYYYRGEDLNLARIVYDLREVHGHEFVWWQTHVRGWEQDDGSVRLRSHYELEPTEYDRDHVDGMGIDVATGTDDVATVLENGGLSYDRYRNLPAGGDRSRHP